MEGTESTREGGYGIRDDMIREGSRRPKFKRGPAVVLDTTGKHAT